MTALWFNASSGKESLAQANRIVWGLLLPLHVLLLGWLACCTSATSDEVAHLAAGVRIWKEGKFDLYPVNPPLVKAIATIPVMLDSPNVDWWHFTEEPGSRPEWLVGQSYLFANPDRFRWHFVMARWACIPFSLLGLLTCFYWARAVAGPWAGVVAATLWCFSPDVLGHGSLITPDVAAASFGIATVFRFQCWLRSSSWFDALFTGILLGMTLLTKMTWLLLLGVLPVIWILCEITASVRTRPLTGAFSRRSLQVAVLFLISIDVVNVGYLFDGSFRPLGQLQFVSKQLTGPDEVDVAGNRFRGTWAGLVPVPFPSPYLRGIDLQQRDFEGGWKPLVSYMRGELRLGGWKSYYLYGLAVKEPLGLGLLLICGIATWFPQRRCREGKCSASALAEKHAPKSRTSASLQTLRDNICLILPPLALFLFVSSQTGFSRYFRYVLPCLPFLFVICALCWSAAQQSRSRWFRGLAHFAVVSFVFASLSVYPHSLSFFNSMAGGPRNGHWHLLDSNIDWGQDLYFLKDWLKQHPGASPLYLACSGVAGPRFYGIPGYAFPRPDTLREDRFPPGWYAISVNHLHGYDDAPPLCTRFLKQTPIARVGYSILIYHVQESP